MNKLLFFSLYFFSFISFSQDSLSVKKDTSKWTLKTLYSLSGTQTTLSNWNAGGRTNVSVIGFISASAYYKTNRMKWENDVNLALGGIKYIDRTTSHESMQKTDDRIDVSSKFGHHLNRSKYFSVIGGFKTQSLDGYNYPNDSVIISTFMAPGYINCAIGYDYVPSDNFGIFISPFATKMTFVKSQFLADKGAFGVDKAITNEVGEIIKRGKQFRGEFGAYFKIKWNKTVAKNIEMKSKLDLFSNYNQNPQNIDVNAETIFTFKVNSWFSSSIQLNLVYDDDIMIKDSFGRTGPRTQFKSIIGMGISYSMKNFS
jgi:hypothetical protein